MLGEIFALGGALSNGIEEILHRHILKNEESLSYTVVWHVLVALFLLPLFLLDFRLPSEPGAWLWVALSGITWAGGMYLMFKSYNTLEVSVKMPIWKSRMLFAFLFAVLLLGESAGIAKILGTLLIFAGIVVVTYEPKAGFSKLRSEGVVLVLLAGVLSALALIIDKIGVAYFPAAMFGSMSAATTALLLLPFVLGKKQEFSSLFRHRPYATLGAGFFGALAYFLMLSALKVIDASIAIPIFELGTLIAVGGGIIVLHEREGLVKKLIAALLAVAGAILVGL